jgi:hypothetical protein
MLKLCGNSFANQECIQTHPGLHVHSLSIKHKKLMTLGFHINSTNKTSNQNIKILYDSLKVKINNL